ncbi:hypothetical protein DRJ12_03210 [Candidatus Acetothermia bacterium]|nr:MAG: hypothetical protein DRJ12_03210 [Candidatus Acetothermia bacterium]
MTQRGRDLFRRQRSSIRSSSGERFLRGVGACPVIGTANTMQILVEAMGKVLSVLGEPRSRQSQQATCSPG